MSVFIIPTLSSKHCRRGSRQRTLLIQITFNMLRWFHGREPTSPDQWTQREHDAYDSWLDEVVAQAKKKAQDFHPVVKELQDLIDKSTRLTQLVQGMYDELSLRPLPRGKKVPYRTDIHDYKNMLWFLNHFLTVPVL